MPEQKEYGDIATVGELLSICEEIVSEHGEGAEVMIQRPDGIYVVPSPTFTEPEDWDPYDNGSLSLLED